MIQIALYRGRGTLLNAIIRRWQRSPYSHCELITRTVGDMHECWSASVQDGGVRCKVMRLNPDHWDLFAIPLGDRRQARAWFEQHDGDGYDLAGLLGFAWRPWHGIRSRWWCSEAVAAALGLPDPYRFDVATLASVVRRNGFKVAL